MQMIILLALSQAFAQEDYGTERPPLNEDALATDIALTAIALDLPEELVAEKIAFEEDFRVYSEAMYARYPDQIAAVWVDLLPAVGGHIRFIGEVPPAARIDGEWAETLRPDQVHLTADGLLTQDEHMFYATMAGRALLRAGYDNFETYYDVFTGTTRVEMQVPDTLDAPVQEDIERVVHRYIVALERAEGLPDPQIREILDAVEVDLLVTIAEGPLFEVNHTRGGNTLSVNGASTSLHCTSGFAWTSFLGSPGILTAGHCNNTIDFFQDDIALDYDMTFQAQGTTAWGDVQWHTTPTHTVLPEFWASSTDLRAVLSVWNGQVGDSTCRYGRASNIRDCGMSVLANGVTITAGGVTYQQMTRIQAPSSIATGGDSGGGYSFGNKAFGTHTADNNANREWGTSIGTAQISLPGTALMIGP